MKFKWRLCNDWRKWCEVHACNFIEILHMTCESADSTYLSNTVSLNMNTLVIKFTSRIMFIINLQGNGCDDHYMFLLCKHKFSKE